MTSKRNSSQSKGSLRRVLGKTTAMLLTAAMIIGTGLFAALGESAEKAGAGLPLAIAIGGVIVLLVGLSAASVGINIPEEGGGFTWSRKFGYPTIGFIAGCAYLGKGIVSSVVISLAFATYTAQAFEGLPPFAMHIMASAAVVAVAGLNYFGIEVNAKAAIGLLFVELLLLGIFIAFAAPAVRVEHLAPVLGNGVFGVLAGAAIFFWSWDGFMRMAIMASEVKDPPRTIPFAVVGGIAFAAVVFLIVAVTVLGVLGPDAMKGGGETASDTPLLTAGVKVLGQWGLWIVLAAAWIDTLTEAHGDMLTATRVALAMGKARELPAWLGAIHERTKSPRHAVLALGVVCATLVLFLDLRPVLEIANVFTLIWYCIVQFDALKLPRVKRLVPPWVTWLGLTGCVALFASLPVWAVVAGIATLALVTALRWLIRRFATSPGPS